jgi:SagB-type dehydrogenase family enzyme
MKFAKGLAVAFLLCVLLSSAAPVTAQDAPATIQLPPAQTDGGKPLMQALKARRTSREFSNKELPLQVLSNLLWAANGINRPDGHRTAPSAMNWQEIDIYVTLAKGVYLHDAKAHALKLVVAGDLRAKAGKQGFVADAPVNLIYVADYARVNRATGDDRLLYTSADAGFISQNVYLFCALEGLATVVRGYVDRDELAKAIKLRAEQRIILAQTVGYPK